MWQTYKCSPPTLSLSLVPQQAAVQPVQKKPQAQAPLPGVVHRPFPQPYPTPNLLLKVRKQQEMEKLRRQQPGSSGYGEVPYPHLSPLPYLPRR